MHSSINVLIFVAASGYFAWRYYRRGLWLAVLGLVGFILAYALCYAAIPLLWPTMRQHGALGMVSGGAALFAMLWGVSAAISGLPPRIWPRLREASQRLRWAGAGLGFFVGALLGFVLIWAMELLVATSRPNNTPPSDTPRDPLANTATQFIAGAVRTGISLVEDDPFRVNATAALVSKPQVYTAALTELSNSGKLQALWHDGETQFLMGDGNTEALRAHPTFRELADDPGLQTLLEASRPEGRDQADAEHYLAEQLSFVYSRMRALRSDPRVVAILEDPEIKKLVHEQKTLTLISHPKIQRLVNIVMEDAPKDVQPEPIASDANTDLGPTPTPKIIYRWMDDDGKMRYTDRDNTPPDRRETAEIIKY